MARYELKTTEYQFSHGRQPRGYGSWAFEIKGGSETEAKVEWFKGTYTEAKAQAIKVAKARHLFSTINVLP